MTDLGLVLDTVRERIARHQRENIGEQDTKAALIVPVLRALGWDVRGYALALTNDSSYWRPPTVPRATIDAAFRLHEGATLSGQLGWAPHAGAGTTRGRDKVHRLHGAYRLHWADYSEVAPGPAGTFRYLLVEASAPASASP